MNLKVCNLLSEITNNNYKKKIILLDGQITILKKFKKKLMSFPDDIIKARQEKSIEQDMFEIINKKKEYNSKLESAKLYFSDCKIIQNSIEIINTDINKKNIFNIFFIIFFLIPFLCLGFLILTNRIKFKN